MSSIKEKRQDFPWHPGSFTKNFSWGLERAGLSYLRDALRVGFDERLEPVQRSVFISRLVAAGFNYYIPCNFFVYNGIINGESFMLPDELVFNAIERSYSKEFDSLALSSFLISIVGRWSGSKDYQKWPAMWAHYFVRDCVYSYDAADISANNIERYLTGDRRYKAKTTRKVSTNLSFLLRKGNILSFKDPKISRRWIDAIFLALDRISYESSLTGSNPVDNNSSFLLHQYGVLEALGPKSLEKELALKHVLRLYEACGATERFNVEYVRQLTELTLQDVQWVYQNDFRPVGALHQSNPRLVKSIPPSCAHLARYAGFDVLEADDFESLDTAEIVRSTTRKVIDELARRNVFPTMTTEEVMRLTRAHDDDD